MSNQTIPCPNCNSPIAFNPMDLLQGGQAKCTNCDTIIALSNTSTDQAKDALNKLNDLKNPSKTKK